MAEPLDTLYSHGLMEGLGGAAVFARPVKDEAGEHEPASHDYSARIRTAIGAAPTARVDQDGNLVGSKYIEGELEMFADYRTLRDGDLISFEQPQPLANQVRVSTPAEFIELYWQALKMVSPNSPDAQLLEVFVPDIAHELRHFESFLQASRRRSLEPPTGMSVSFFHVESPSGETRCLVLPEVNGPARILKGDLTRAILAPMDEHLAYDIQMVHSLGYSGTPQEILNELDNPK